MQSGALPPDERDCHRLRPTDMLTKDQFQELAKKAIGFTSFPECSISLSNTENAFIRFALNGVTTSGFVANQSMSISVTKDKKTGSTSVDEFDEKAIREAVQGAEQLALLSPANPGGCRRRSGRRNIRASTTGCEVDGARAESRAGAARKGDYRRREGEGTGGCGASSSAMRDTSRSPTRRAISDSGGTRIRICRRRCAMPTGRVRDGRRTRRCGSKISRARRSGRRRSRNA